MEEKIGRIVRNEIQLIKFYSDYSCRSVEMLKRIKKEFSNVKIQVIYCTGPDDKIPHIEIITLTTSSIEGAENIRLVRRDDERWFDGNVVSGIKRITFYTDGSHLSGEMLKEVRERFPDVVIEIVDRMGPERVIPVIITTTGRFLHGASEIRSHILRENNI